MNTPFHLQQLAGRVVELPLAQPLVTSSARFERREVVIIEATVRFGERSVVVGYGESAPLPGWSPETAQECLTMLTDLPNGVDFDSVLDLDAHLPSLAEHPALRFGVELALLDAIARFHEAPICRLLIAGRGRLPLASVPVQYTIGAVDTRETCERARRAADEGYECVKLKVGAAPMVADLARIGRVRQACPSMKIRLDANGAWTTGNAIHLLRGLSRGSVDLVEQPVAPDDLDALLDAVGNCDVAIAPDESCVPIERARALIDSGRIRAVVLKPSALGGLLPTAALIETAHKRGVRVVLSTLIESAIGRSAIAQLAAAYPDIPGPHGLATGPWLARDVADEPDHIEAGRLVLRPGPGVGFEPRPRAAHGRPTR